MKITSLSQKTDLLFSKFSGQVIDKGEYLLIQTPENPTFHWGNYILFQEAPQKGDYKKWTELFKHEFPYYDEIRHYVFAWPEDCPGESQEFLDNGFELEKVVALTAKKVVKPPKYNSQIMIKKLITDAEWEDAIHNQVCCAKEKFAGPGYEVFKRKQFAQYRLMYEQGRGNWYGAYIDGRLVGDLGIFTIDNIGRFQNVGTHPDFRRQGICQTLVYETALQSLAEDKIETLVMEADSEYYAARIYESVGFKPTENHFSLSWWHGGQASTV
ncbi:MAG: GNAT family N-acetyltransferase [candidate division Zixibacteria bacterium]|nr:GNAT family N-acetyltransferase [candidate division Zixibacteria bacterium]